MALTKHTWLYSNLLRVFKPYRLTGRKTPTYLLTVLSRENIRQLWGFNRGDLNISASAVPNNKDTFKAKRNGKLQRTKLFKQ